MLKVSGLSAAYSGIEALRNVEISVEVSEIVAIIGPNGAGKSTLLNCLSGIVRPKAGSILFEGREMAGLAPYTVARAGLLQVPEGRQILSDLSVFENLQLGRLAAGNRKPKHDLTDIYDLFPVLREKRDARAGALSGGQQQMLAIGRALMGAPRLLLLDEPSLGLSPLLTQQVFGALKQLNETGVTILVVEQNARRALTLSHRAYIVEQGRIAFEGRSDALIDEPRVLEHYLGEEPEPASA